MTKVITVTNFKGGVGKSSIALNLAYELSCKDKQVLLVDMDPQGNLSHFLRVDSAEMGPTTLKLLSYKRGVSIANVIASHELDIPSATLEEASYETAWKNVRCVPANLTLLRVKDALLQNPHALTFAIDAYLKTEAGAQCDYVIIDTHPDLDIKVTNAIMAADVAIVPVKFDGAFVEGLQETIDAIERTTADLRIPLGKEPVRYRAVANCVDFRTGRDQAGVQTLAAVLDSSDRFACAIPDTVKIGEASMRGLAVGELSRWSGAEKAQHAFNTLAEEVIDWVAEGEVEDVKF